MELPFDACRLSLDGPTSSRGQRASIRIEGSKAVHSLPLDLGPLKPFACVEQFSRRRERVVGGPPSKHSTPCRNAGLPIARQTGALMPDNSPTRYAKTSDGVHIAYQTLGKGPRDLVLIEGFISHVEIAWEEPGIERFRRELAVVLPR